ncbi:molybdopterin-dependent oxidoreductase [Desulfomarina sp.]
MEKKKTICPLDCPDSCGIVATIEDGRVVSITGDREHPVTNGFICRKMRKYPERLYGDSGILFPQVRESRKGEGRFRRVSWDEAFDLLVEKLAEIKRKYGADTILPYSYAGNMGAVNRFAGYPFFHKLGASRLDQTICSAAAGAGWKKQCGNMPGSPPEKAGDADLVVCWGINCRVTNIHFWQYVVEARKKGGRLLVIDPYRNSTGRSADIYVSLEPGGDVALALGMIKALLELDRQDNSFIENNTTGFEKLAVYLRETGWREFTDQCGVNREQITDLALLLANQPKTFLRIGIGLSRNRRGGMALRAITSLAAVLGLFGEGTGRGVLYSSGAFQGRKAELTRPDLAEKTTRKVNMIQLGQALTTLDPPVMALFVYNSNPLSVAPDSAMVKKGLLRDDLFTVVHEQVMTPTARYADLLLPATTFLENRDVYTAYGHFYMGVVEPVIPPRGEAMSNFDFFQTLARKMGYDDPVFSQSCDERIRNFLIDMDGLPGEVALDQVMAGGYVHSTRSRKKQSLLTGMDMKFRFSAPFSPLEPEIPCLQPGKEFDDIDLLGRFPYKLITPPHADLLNSTFGESQQDFSGEVLIHPEDAEKAGIVHGDLVILENFRGRTSRVAHLTKDTRRGLLVAEGIFWQSEKNEGAINDLTSQNLTDMGGGALFHESRVRLMKPES